MIVIIIIFIGISHGSIFWFNKYVQLLLKRSLKNDLENIHSSTILEGWEIQL